MKRFTLYGSPHSLPTYKVALMLRLSNEPFSFRYVSFQKGMHKTPEFLALSRWRQVPVLIDRERAYLQSAAIVEHLAGTLGRFQGADAATRQSVQEWLY
jgi:glutathione S-transferase